MLINRYKIKGVDFKYVIVKKEIKKLGKKQRRNYECLEGLIEIGKVLVMLERNKILR